MRRLMVLLSLLAALSGTPLRQAEAADDGARTRAEEGGGAGVEAVDGGVGDDAHVAPEPDAPTDLIPIGGFFPVDEFRPIRVIETPRADPPPERPGRRRAWLQRFLF